MDLWATPLAFAVDPDEDDGPSIPDIFGDVRIWQTLAGFCGFLAVVTSLIHITRHSLYNRSRGIKECTLRMLILVPLYALDAFVCVMNPESTYIFILTAIRDFYEAVVLTSFVQFLLVVLGGPGRGAANALAEKMLLHKPEHTGPLCAWRRLKMQVGMFWQYKAGPDFISWVLIGILQYSVVMLMSLFARIMLWPVLNHYGLFKSDLEKISDVVLLQIKACSCGWAMYNLLLLGVNLQTCSKTKHSVEEISLEVKFLSVKGIVFFTFLQQWGFKVIVIRIMQPEGDRMEQMSADSVKDFSQNVLLCFETLLFAFWHWRAYAVDEFNKMAMRMQLTEAMREVDDVRPAIETPDGHRARKELERAIDEAKPFLEHQFIVGAAEVARAAEVVEAGEAVDPSTPHSDRGGGIRGSPFSPHSTVVDGDAMQTVVLRDLSRRQSQVSRPLRLVLQDDTLRSAEAKLKELPTDRPVLCPTGSFTSYDDSSPRWARTWYCVHKYLRNFVQCCLCDFWFCLFWPKGTIGIFATFSLYDEIRRLRTRANVYLSAVEVLPLVEAKPKSEVTFARLEEAFNTFDTMAGRPGTGMLESREELECLANGLGYAVDLKVLFDESGSPVSQKTFVERLSAWHNLERQPTKGSISDTISAPLLVTATTR